MLNLNRATALLLSLGFATAMSAAHAAGPTGSAADYGSVAINAAAERDISIDAGTKWINVTNGETVRISAGGQSFVYHVDTYPNTTSFALSKIAPAGVQVGDVKVYVASNPLYRG